MRDSAFLSSEAEYITLLGISPPQRAGWGEGKRGLSDLRRGERKRPECVVGKGH